MIPGRIIPGRVIPRRIIPEDSSRKESSLEESSFKESSIEELSLEDSLDAFWTNILLLFGHLVSPLFSSNFQWSTANQNDLELQRFTEP